MTKSIIFNLLLFVLFFYTTVSKAQTVELITPSSKEITLKIGEAPKALSLQYTNTGSTNSAPATVRISVPAAQKGIYIYAESSLPAGLTATEDVNKSYIDFNVPSLPAAGTVLLPLKIQGGYCFEFSNGSNQVILPNLLLGVTGTNLKLTVNQSTSLSQVFSQNKVYRNGDPTPVSVGSLMTVEANLNDVIVREYIYQNSSSTDSYTGVAQLDGPNITQPVNVTNLKVFVSDANDQNRVEVTGATKDLANWLISVPVQVPANGRLIFQETVVVNGCLTGAFTNIDLYIGVGTWDNCGNTKVTLGPNLNPIKGISFAIDKENSNFMPDLKCITNGVSSHHRNLIYNYTGTATALNNTFSLFKIDREAFVVTKNSIKLSITRNGVKNTYTIDWSPNDILAGQPSDRMLTWNDFVALYPAILTNPDMQAELEYYCFHATHVNSSSVYYIKSVLTGRNAYERANANALHPFLFNFFTTYGDYLQNNGYTSYGANASFYYPFIENNLPQGLNTEMVFNAQISHYFDNGVSTSITMNPGDKVELEWDEYTSCLNQYRALSTFGFWPYTHSEDACQNITYSGYGQFGYFGGSQTVIQDPGNSNISGENDRCTLTQDGQIENVSFKLTPNLGQGEPINDLTGKLVFKVYLDDGLDMDASFATPTALGLTKRGYDDLTTPSTCDQNCDPACSPNRVLTQPVFNVKYTLANGTVIDLSNHVQLVAAHNDPAAGNQLNYLKSPGYNAVPSVAYYLYTVEMDLALLNITAPANADKTQLLNAALKDGRLTFDVRCYCPASNPSGKAGIQVVTLFDKCENRAATQSCDATYFTNLWALGYTQFGYQINCPGCKIPGSNIGASTFLRQNVGLVDVNKNGFPDDGNAVNPQNGEIPVPDNDIVRRSGSEGDIMKAKYMVEMSNGSAKSEGKGFLKQELEADGVILDNLIVKVTIASSTTTYQSGTAKVTYHTSTYPVTDYWQIGNTAFFRIPASLIHSETMLSDGSWVSSFNESDPLQFEADFRLKDLQADNSNLEVVYQAGYTPCETCTSGFYAVSPAFNNTGDYDAVLANKENLFLMCTDGGTYFKGVPFRSERNLFSTNRFNTAVNHNNETGSNCKKTLAVRNWGEFGYTNNFGYSNMFETECRYFFDETKPFRSELTLPAGYVVDRIEVTSNASQAGYRYNETYTIQASEMANYADPNKNGFWTSTTALGNDVIGFNLFYQHESESDASTYIPQGNNIFSKDVTSNILPAFLIVKDEQWYSHVYVILKPKTNCTPDAQVQVYPEDHYLKNVPTYPSNDPSILADPDRTLAFSYVNPFGHDGPLVTLPDGKIQGFFTPVHAELEIKNITDQALTVNGNVLDLRINLKELTSTYQADYPFLVLEGPALTPSKGLDFEGLYWNGNKSSNYPVYYDKPNNRILIGINSTNNTYLDGSQSYSFPAIPKGSSNDYTIRFTYSCSSITDQGCGGNPVVTNGLNNDELTIRPGYACSYTPDFAQYDQALYCGIFEPISYRLSSQVYGSNIKPSFVVQGNTIDSPAPATLATCENFKYNMTLGSCQEGPVKGFEVMFSNLPAGLSITGVSILQNSNFTVVQDNANPLVYLISTNDPANYISIANNNPIVVSFDMAIACSFATSDLQVIVNGIATCGGNLSANAFVHHLIAAPSVFDNVATTLQCSASSVALSYTSSALTTHNNTIVITLPNGLEFADDGATTRTIGIPVGTTGSNSFTYPINVRTAGSGTITAMLNQNLTVQCTSEEPCEKSNTTATECTLDYCSITALAGPDQAGCSGLSYTLSMANVQPGFTYTWTGGGQSYLGSTVYVSPAVTTTYTLTVRSTTNVNCFTSDDVTVTILNPSVTLVGADHVCPQSSGTLTAQLSGANSSDLQFTWYKIINGTPQVLDGPGNQSTYSYTGLTETTLFEVKVSTTTGTCTASANLTVTLYALPTLTIIAPAEFCIGSAPAVITAAPAGGYFEGNGVTLTSGIYTFNATTAGNYTVTYYYTDPVTGCSTSKPVIIVVNPCCKYALKTTEVMCGEDAIRCITLQAVKPVDNGIKGMDFILKYDRTLMTPTGLPGRGNATLGNVVLNGGMTSGMGSYAMTQRTIAGTNFNELSVSIFYTGQAPAAADFDGIGDVICIEFKILSSGTTGAGGTTKSIFIGDFYQTGFSQGVVDDEHKLFMIRSCVENNGVGVISILKNNFLNGKVYYHNDTNAPLKYDAATPGSYLMTTIAPITTGYGSSLCTPSSVAAKTTDINGAYTIDLTGANGVKVSRDIAGDYYNSCTDPSDVIDQTGNVYDPGSLLMAINGYDAYLMESITTMRSPSDVVYVADRKVPGVSVPLTANSAFPTAFQMIASDVNMDRMIRAVDISLVQERAVSKLCEYPQVWNYNLGVDPAVYPLNTADQRSLDWRFVDKSQVTSNLTYIKSSKYPLPAGVTGTGAAYYWRDNVPNPPRCLMGPMANANTCKSYANSFDIHAIMLGDIDGSWRANLNNSQKNLRTVSDRQVVINLTNKQRKGINTYRVPVTFISQDPATVSLDFALDYNEEELRIIGVGNLEGGDLAEPEVVYNDFENKQLLFTSYTMTGFNSANAIYYIDFVSKNGEFNANMLGKGDAYLNGERVDLVVEGSTITGIENQLLGSQYGFELVPNPAANEGEILYNIKAGSQAKIVVYNTLGQVITEYKDLEGQGSIQVGTSDWSSGMYQVILFTENSQKLIKKWVIQN